MENTKKKLWMACGISFAAGIAVTVTALSLCCCPMHLQHKNFEHHQPLKIEMMKEGGQHVHHRGNIAKIGHHHRQHTHAFDELRPEPTPEMKAKFAERLGLTDEQKEKLEVMRKEDMAKMEPLFEQMKNLRQEMKDLRQVNRQHFESVLTDEQKVILQEMKKAHHH